KPTANINPVWATVHNVNGPPTAGTKKSPMRFQTSIIVVTAATHMKVLTPKILRLNHEGAVSHTSGIFFRSLKHESAMKVQSKTAIQMKLIGIETIPDCSAIPGKASMNMITIVNIGLLSLGWM